MRHAVQPRRATPLSACGVLVAVVLAGIAFAGAVAPVEATDYTPGSWWYFKVVNGKVGEPTGTVLDVASAVSVWNSWLGAAELTYTTSVSGCGSTTNCVVYGEEGDSITINGDVCTFQDVPSTSWARAFIDAGPGYRTVGTDCGGTANFPVFPISVSVDHTFSTTQKVHIARHELGHPLNLPDAPSSLSCWTSVSKLYPLMKNSASNCASYPSNQYATPNEIDAVIARNGY